MNKYHHQVTPQFAAWASMLRTHKYLLEQVQASLASAGLPTLEWYDVLLELDFAENNRLRLFELGERIVLSRSNLTRLCDRLERQELIRRENCSEDLRGLYAVLTPKGRELRRQMWPVYRKAVETHFSESVTEDEANTLTRIMLKIRKTTN